MPTFRQLGLLLLAAAAVMAAACDREPPRQRVRLAAEPAARPTSAQPPPHMLRLGVASARVPPRFFGHYRELVEFLGEQLGVDTEIVQRPSYSETIELLRQRFCTVALLCDYAFIRAQREFGAECLATQEMAGEQTYQAYIIVPQDSRLRSFSDLAGKRFAFADSLCNAGWLYPRYRVRQLGRASEAFFGASWFTLSYEKSIRVVAEGLADGAGVESTLYDRLVAQDHPAAEATRIIERSPPFGNPPVVVRRDIDPDLRTRIRTFFLSLHETERGRAILAGIHVDRFVPPAPELYAPVDRMAQAIEEP
jgi:phosphonate transport system substrate-binding protein